MMKNCPHCHTPITNNALFCPHCMTQLKQKQQIQTPKITQNKPKKVFCLLLAVFIFVSALSCGAVAFYKKQHAPICSYEQFKAAAPIVSKKMGIDDLWSVDDLVDTHYIEKEKAMQYSAEINLENEVLSLFFVNKGEQILAYITDVELNDYANAESILKCVTQSICNYYFTDIDNVFDNEKLYPKSIMDVPFDSSVTDLVKRTDNYNKDIKNGAKISTRYIQMTSDEHNDLRVVFYITERNTNGNIIYDLFINIYRD